MTYLNSPRRTPPPGLLRRPRHARSPLDGPVDGLGADVLVRRGLAGAGTVDVVADDRGALDQRAAAAEALARPDEELGSKRVRADAAASF